MDIDPKRRSVRTSARKDISKPKQTAASTRSKRQSGRGRGSDGVLNVDGKEDGNGNGIEKAVVNKETRMRKRKRSRKGEEQDLAASTVDEHGDDDATSMRTSGRNGIGSEVINTGNRDGEVDDQEGDGAGAGIGAGEIHSMSTSTAYWLMKAEPESRLEKGKDVRFSIEDLEAAREPEGWDGEVQLTCFSLGLILHC